MNMLARLQELDELRKLHLHQLQNKAMAPFCAASKESKCETCHEPSSAKVCARCLAVEEGSAAEQPEDRMAPCHNCGQFRGCSAYKGEWYCKVKCSARAKKGVLSRKRAQDIPPRSGR